MGRTKEKSSQELLLNALRAILYDKKSSTQEGLCLALEKQGFSIKQSTVSRMLRNMGAIKVKNKRGQIVYSLPREPAPPLLSSQVRHLILDIVMNETLVVISTSPGSASMIARILDFHQASLNILGTIAGDDTLFIAPKSVKNIKKMHREIQAFLTNIPHRES